MAKSKGQFQGRSHRCQQRHHAECMVYWCACKCHDEQWDYTIGPAAGTVAECIDSVNSALAEAKAPVTSASKGKACPGHTSPVLVLDGALKVYAGSSKSKCPDGATFLDLAGYGAPNVLVHGLPWTYESKPRVAIWWPDMQAPQMSRAKWADLVSRLVADGKPLYVACQAGHGRTGTALAIIGCLMGAIPEGCPVTWLRENYCRDMVESKAQIEYVKEMTGREVTATAGFSGVTYVQEPWIAGTPLDQCKYYPAHAGCDKYGHAPKDKPKPPSPPSTTGGLTTATVKAAVGGLQLTTPTLPDGGRCLVCHAYPQYGGHMAHCSLAPGKVQPVSKSKYWFD